MLNEAQFKFEAVLDVAKKMAIAARTAPKARGVDNLEIKIAIANDILSLARKMEEIGNTNEQANFFERCRKYS
ncbi:hypothetical protein LJC11_04765 [Bacteroidales bacterium OttesenSCG-928-I21]|nr:hypothetical protein [Bacteroidales bacterium OttesenSCG-928-I21]